MSMNPVYCVVNYSSLNVIGLGAKNFINSITVNSRFKKDLNLQIHLHKAFFSDNRILDSYHKSFLNQTTLDLRKEEGTFLNREFTVEKKYVDE